MMPDEIDRYTYRVSWSDEDQEHIGLCAELPGLSWLASKPELALKGIRKLAGETIIDLAANGEPVPEAIAARNYSGKFIVRVPPDTHRALTLEAAEAGISLNRLIASKLT